MAATKRDLHLLRELRDRLRAQGLLPGPAQDPDAFAAQLRAEGRNSLLDFSIPPPVEESSSQNPIQARSVHSISSSPPVSPSSSIIYLDGPVEHHQNFAIEPEQQAVADDDDSAAAADHSDDGDAGFLGVANDSNTVNDGVEARDRHRSKRARETATTTRRYFDATQPPQSLQTARRHPQRPRPRATRRRGRARNQRPQPNPRPARQHAPTQPHLGSLDLDCVSNWEPVPHGADQNFSPLLDPQGRVYGFCIKLHTGERLIPHGTLKLKVIYGIVAVAGFKVTARASRSIEILAPSSHPLPAITALVSPQNPASQPSKFSAIILLTDFETGIEQLDPLYSSYSPQRPLWVRSPSPSSPITGKTWNLVMTLTPELGSLSVPPTWRGALDNLVFPPNQPPIYMIDGEQAAGKSTLAILLINTLLNTFKQVAVLDVDPGQPLLTPSTLMSLHVLEQPIVGPSFCRLIAPQRNCSHSIYLGHITPQDCPTRYIAAAQDLMNVYHTLHQDTLEPRSTLQRIRRKTINGMQLNGLENLPLVVNTIGWDQGLGQELLVQLRAIVRPTKIFTLSQHHSNFQLDVDPRVFQIDPIGVTTLSARLTATDRRTLNTLSYLYSSPRVNSSHFIDRWEFKQPIWTRIPFDVHNARIEIPELTQLAPEFKARVLNGALVGFVDTDSQQWIGFGLIRSIDANKRTLHLLTPAAPNGNDTREIRFVKYSEPDLPIIPRLMLDGEGAEAVQASAGRIPYLQITLHRLVGDQRKIRRNIQRR